MARVTRAAFVKGGKWRTIATHWSTAKARFYFRRPAGAKIRLRYGVGWFSVNRQKKTLDGQNEKIISVGFWSATRSKVQVRSDRDINFDYDYEPLGP